LVATVVVISLAIAVGDKEIPIGAVASRYG
jgi:hypothetical protein